MLTKLSVFNKNILMSIDFNQVCLHQIFNDLPLLELNDSSTFILFFFSLGLSRAFIIADVLVSKTCLGNATLNVPGDKMDTAISPNRHVYVKFNDHEFLPINVVFYDAPDRSTSRHFRQHRRRLFLW